MNITEIPISQIVDNPHQKRKYYGDIKSLADSISERGLQNPISVIKIKDDGYVVVSGHRRLRAFKNLHRKSIPAIIRKESTQEDLAKDIAIENLQREDLRPDEKGETILQLFYTLPHVKKDKLRALTIINQVKLYDDREHIGKDFNSKLGFEDADLFNARKLLKLVGVSPNTATQYIRITHLPKSIRDNVVFGDTGSTRALPKGSISVKMAYELTRVKDRNVQNDLFKKITKDGVKYIEAKFMVDEIIASNPMIGNRNGGKGTAGRRVKDDQGTEELTKELFDLSSTVWNFRMKLPTVCKRLDKILWVASLKKMKKACLQMVLNINELLNEDMAIEERIEFVNTDLELQIKPPGRPGEKLRFSFPRDKANLLKIGEGDCLQLDVTGIIRGVPA